MLSQKLLAVSAICLSVTLSPFVSVYASTVAPQDDLTETNAFVEDLDMEVPESKADQATNRVGVNSRVISPMMSPIDVISENADLGDAPTTCKWGGMKTYSSGVLANYPTIWKDPDCPIGPIHHNLKLTAWLGHKWSGEVNAHVTPDMDGFTNIDVKAGVANRDRHDDGVLNPKVQSSLALPACGSTTFKFIVTRNPGAKALNYKLNAWFDWNRDGDWADTVTCKLSGGIKQSTPERGLSNIAIPLAACPVGGGVCSTVFTSPSFKTATLETNSNPKELWMRVSLTNVNVAADNKDGSGPAAGYDYGETEDYLLTAQSFDGTTWIFGNSLGEEGEPHE